MKLKVTEKELLEATRGMNAKMIIDYINENKLGGENPYFYEKIEFKSEKKYVLVKSIVINGELKDYYFVLGENLTTDITKAETFPESDKKDSYWNDYTKGNKFEFYWKEV